MYPICNYSVSITKRSKLNELKKKKVQTAKTQLKSNSVFKDASELLIFYDFIEIGSYEK